MSLNNLRPFFGDDEIVSQGDHKQIRQLYEQFIDDFETNPFKLNDKEIRIDSKPSKVKEYATYGETFYHLITRLIRSTNRRIFECKRANRVAWIKPILLSHPTNQIWYYKWKDDKGICKEHFWLKSKKYMVVLKDVNPELQVVTAFCVDDDDELRYFERYKNYENGKSNC